MDQPILCIAGSGPAAYSCAITAAQRGLKPVICGSGSSQGWLYRTDRIANYPGLPDISGKELLQRMQAHAEAAGTEFRRGVVRQISKGRRNFRVLIENDIITADAVVLAIGAARPKLLPGEEENLGQGVSWCGTCDGMFYRGKEIAVLSWWEGGVEEGIFLSGLASVCDYYKMANHEIPGNPPFTVRSDESRSPAGIRREGDKLLLDFGDHTRAYDGIFLFRPAVAPERMLAHLETDGGFIRTDRRMATSVPLVYAAGDCTGKPLQVAKAVGEGNIAAISAAEDLQALKNS